ncbi:metallophosphoesterase [Saccharicrinis sp. FJH62]|uniref:metallophosphoesterase n=1 Tax=Saccharicrinis sp. FJH62 TaxID=3344657 RepID=UPI0035D4CD55
MIGLFKWKYATAFLIAGILILSYAYIETYWIKTKKLTIYSENLPASFNGKKLVFISDVHLGPYISEKRVQKVVKRINALQPDIILLSGDYIDMKAKYIAPVFDALQILKAPMGKYGVLGNHEFIEDPQQVIRKFRESKINLCHNNSFWITEGRDSIKIGGVGDLWESDQKIENTINDVRDSDFCILLSHNPDYMEELKTNKIDLMLSGHTHGGQVTLFGLWAPLLPSDYGQKYRYGLRQVKHTQLYVTSGVGVVGVPFRFFCRPEIVEITLKTTKD